MLVPLVEHVMQNFLGFDLTAYVSLPKLKSRLFVGLIRLDELRNNDQLLNSIIEVFLVVVEGRVFNLLYFLVFFGRELILNYFVNSLSCAVALDFCLLQGLFNVQRSLVLHQIQELRDVENGVFFEWSSRLHA